MAHQGAPALASIPPPSHPILTRPCPEKALNILLNLLGGPYLLCKQSIIESLQAVRSLASTILKPGKVELKPKQSVQG